MRNPTLPRPHSTHTSRAGRRSHHSEPRSGRRPSVQLISEGVVAGYIHDISQRHHLPRQSSGGTRTAAARSPA